MTQNAVPPYVFDPEDPRAPSTAQWLLMDPGERARVVDALPTSLPIELHPPEGDTHRKTKTRALAALDDHFRRTKRKLYLTSELAVFYPGEPSFVPDILAVLDVEPHDRNRWVVDAEGKGVDFVLEVLVAGDRAKDLGKNPDRFARLGITEYAVFDRPQARLHLFRLEGRKYTRVVPQEGRYASQVLELDLLVERGALQFMQGTARLEDLDERIGRLGIMLDEVLARAEREAARAEREAERAEHEAERAEHEAERAEHEAERAEHEAERAEREAARAEHEAARASALEAELAEARAEIARLKGR